MIFKSCVTSKAAKTLIWILLSIFCCAGIVIFLSSLDSSASEDISSLQIEFSPKPNQGKVIYYRYEDHKSIKKWTDKIDNFLKPYRKHHSNRIECSFKRQPAENEVCNVDLDHLRPCTGGLDYGYSKATPCIFFKFRETTSFTPEFLTLENISNSGLGYESSRFIREQDTVNHPEILKMIWVSCEGKTSFDNTLLGDVRYFPKRGFPGYFFNGGKHDEPLVAVQFENPRIGTIIDIDCKVVARNFNETISFKLLVERE